jgi:hypothetical protein
MSEKPDSDAYGLTATDSGAASARKERPTVEFHSGQMSSSIKGFSGECC